MEELVELSRYPRKSVLRLLEVFWEGSDDLSGKRLAAVLLTLVPALERPGHLEFEPALRQKLLQLSPASFDRLQAPARSAQGGAASSPLFTDHHRSAQAHHGAHVPWLKGR